MADLSFGQQMSMLRQQQRREQRWSARQAREQMRFQQHMSDTAHQREVADLQAAGLNPVLSAGGQGASGANGAMASSDSILPEMMDVMKTMAASSGGGTKVVVNDDDTGEEPSTPSEAFTTKQMIQGEHANQGAYHGSANNARNIDTAKRVREDALEKVKEAIKPINFNAGVSAGFSGKVRPRINANLSGEDGLNLYKAVKDLAKADFTLGKLTRHKDIEQKAEWFSDIALQMHDFFSHNLSDKDAQKLSENLEKLQRIGMY